MAARARWSELSSASAWTCLVLMCPNTAFAQSASSNEKQPEAQPSDAEDIVVTGVAFRDRASSSSAKLNIPLVETPQAISVVSSEVVQSIGARELVAAINYLPGVQALSSGSDGNQPQITARGFGFDSSNGSYKLNGLNLGDNVQIDGIVIDRLEFVKGANSISYGESVPSGFVNYITKSPLKNFALNYEASVGNYGFLRGAGDVGGPLTESGNLTFRAGGSYEETSVPYRNFDQRLYSLFGALRYELSPDTVANLVVIHQEARNRPGGGAPPSGVLNPFTGANSLAYANLFSARDFYGQSWNSHQEHVDIVQGSIDHSFGGDWHLVLAGARSKTNIFDKSASPYADSDSSTGYYYQSYGPGSFISQSYQAELRLAGKFDLFGRGHELAIFSQYNTNSRGGPYSRLGCFNPLGPVVNGGVDCIAQEYDPTNGMPRLPDPFEGGSPLEGMDSAKRHTLGFAGNVRLNVAKQIKILLGGRYQMFHLQTENTLYGDLTAVPVSTTIVDRQPEFEENKFLPRAAIIVQPTRDVNLYYSFSKSLSYNYNRTCAFDQNGNRTSNDALPGIPATQHEIGAKAELLHGKLLVSVAAYQITQSNNAVIDQGCFRSSGGNLVQDLGYYIATGKARSRGVELEVVGNVTRQLNVVGGFAYTDANTIDNGGDPSVPENVGLTNIPHYTASLFARYDFPEGGWVPGLGFGFGINHVGKRPVDDYGSFTLPADTQVDAAIYYKISDRLNLSFNISNLTDNRIYDGAGGSEYLSTRDRRTGVLSLRGKF